MAVKGWIPAFAGMTMQGDGDDDAGAGMTMQGGVTMQETSRWFARQSLYD